MSKIQSYTAQLFIPGGEEPAAINEKIAKSLQILDPERIGVNEIVPTDNGTYTAFWHNWNLSLSLADKPHVAEEAQEIAALNKTHPSSTILVGCRKRIEIWSQPDPDMVYFNTYVAVMENLEGNFTDSVLVDNDGTII